jgi:putative transposase
MFIYLASIVSLDFRILLWWPGLVAGWVLGLNPRRRVDQAPYGVSMETSIGGVATRRVDALLSALGSQSGISESQVSRIARRSASGCRRSCAARWREAVMPTATSMPATSMAAGATPSRSSLVPLSSPSARMAMAVANCWACRWATARARPSGRSVSIAHLRERGLTGVRLVISDAHAGLTKAIRRQLQASVWQRCRDLHRFSEGFAHARNLLRCVPKANQGMVTAALCSVFAQEPAAEIESRRDDLAASLAEHFPKDHWKQPRRTSLLKRVNVAPRGALCNAFSQKPQQGCGHCP